MTTTTIETVSAERPLTGRVAVVTGASSGIGAATARVLAERGARVAALARREDRLGELAAEYGDAVLAVPVDVTDQSSVDAAAARVAAAFGPVDLVVNNAGVMLPAPVEERRTGDWQRMIDLNLTGALRVIEAFVPNLVAAAAEGRSADLIDISSVAATGTFPGFAVYCATKAAVSHLGRNLRTELGPKFVRVTTVEPGLVATELASHVTDAAANAWLESARGAVQFLTGADVAGVIAYAAALPRHVNLPELVIMPTQQV